MALRKRGVVLAGAAAMILLGLLALFLKSPFPAGPLPSSTKDPEYISAGLLPEDPKFSDYNTSALEQAIATANGREIAIPAGVYYLTGPVTLPGGATISIHGSGQGQTILRSNSGATAS